VCPCARSEMLSEGGVMRRIVFGVFLDRDSGMRRLVLLVQGVVPEVAEDVDGQRDVALLRGRSGGDREARCESRADENDEDQTAPPRKDAFPLSPPPARASLGPLGFVGGASTSLAPPLDARTTSSTGSVNAAEVSSGLSICFNRAQAAARPSPTLSWRIVVS